MTTPEPTHAEVMARRAATVRRLVHEHFTGSQYARGAAIAELVELVADPQPRQLAEVHDILRRAAGRTPHSTPPRRGTG